MRKALMSVALCIISAVLPVSCIVESGSSGSYPDDYTTSESFNLYYKSLENPLETLNEMLLCSEYCFSDPEERKDARFDPLRTDLFLGEKGEAEYHYRKIKFGDIPLHKKGGTLKIDDGGYVWGTEDGWLEFECLEDSTAWSAKFGTCFSTVLSKADEISWKATTSGQCKSHDGYDLAYGTVGDFYMTMGYGYVGYGYVSKQTGIFRHTVSKDGKVLDTCTRRYHGEDGCDVVVERPDK